MRVWRYGTDLLAGGTICYNVTMKATELIEKLCNAIDKYGADCEVDMLEHDCFGSDRYGIGVGLVATQDPKTIKDYGNCKTTEEQKVLIARLMLPMMDAYFWSGAPLW